MAKEAQQKKDAFLRHLGARLRDARGERGLSQEGLALRSDLDRSYIGGVERGERNISAVNLKKVARALDMSLSDLLRGV